MGRGPALIARRGLLTAGLVTGAGMASPAAACRVPVPKDRKGYAAAIDRLLTAWWARDYEAFRKPFQHADVETPFDGRSIFDAHFAKREARFRGEVLFNGATAVVQVVTPQGPDYEHGFCGGYAEADLFLVSFFPGLNVPVIEKVDFIEVDLLAASEWEHLAKA